MMTRMPRIVTVGAVLVLLPLLLLSCGGGKSEATATKTRSLAESEDVNFVEWTRLAASPIDSITPGAPFNGLTTLGDIVGSARIIAVDTNPAKLQLATKLGATDLVNPADGDPVEHIVEMTKGGVHHAIECLGLKLTAEQSFRMLAPGGTATLVGMVPFGEKIELHGADFLRERRIQGSSMGSNRFRVDMPRLIELYLQGRLHLDDVLCLGALARRVPRTVIRSARRLAAGHPARRDALGDRHDRRRLVHPDDIERDYAVLHPERPEVGRGEHEQHPFAIAERLPEHQPALLSLRCRRQLDGDDRAIAERDLASGSSELGRGGQGKRQKAEGKGQKPGENRRPSDTECGWHVNLPWLLPV